MDEFSLTVAIIATISAALASAIAYFTYRSQTDPNVIVYLKDDEKRPSLMVLVIENIGNGIAHDISFKIPEDFPQNANGIRSSGKADHKLMTTGPLVSGIKSLPPRGIRMMNWGQYGGILDYLGESFATIQISYTIKGLFGFVEERITTDCFIEINSFAATDASSRSEAAQLKRIGDLLEGIKKELS